MDSGDGVSHTLPIYEGYAVPHAIQKVNLAGRHLNEYLRQLLAAKGQQFNTSTDMDILRELKEKMCYTVTNYDDALKESEESHANEKTYDLPDGRKVTLGNERFKVAEALFTPTIAGYNMEGLTKYCFDSAMKCDVDVRKELLQNIILAGGSTLFEGMGERVW